jgi:GntR family transcriptional repressor for pyruvate dehydrogenase complex
MKADYEFHRAIAAASGNPFYSDCLASLGPTMIAMPRGRLVGGGEPDAREHFDQVVQEHESIVAAIAEGDGPSSSAAMRSHLANSRRRLRAAAPGNS